jgi:RNA polymerase sigma-70 factor (ECF subfamily)
VLSLWNTDQPPGRFGSKHLFLFQVPTGRTNRQILWSRRAFQETKGKGAFWDTMMTHLAARAGTEKTPFMGDESDEGLMLRYQKGDVRAFEILLGRHRRPIFNFILRYVGVPAMAEDLLQETFLRVIKGAEAYQRQAKFTTWLYTIARNLCVDASRRGKHRKAASLDTPMDSDGKEGATLLDVVADKAAGADRKVLTKELHGRLRNAIAKLSEDQREVFLMREFLDMPFREIADVVGCPENTVKSRMRYALEKLREELEEYADLAKAMP